MSMEILQILTDLEQEIDQKRGLFSKKVDLDLCLELIEEAKSKLPESITEAQYVVEKRRQILENADDIAKKTIHAAEEKVSKMLAQSEIVKHAEAEAQRVMEAAYAQCDVLIQRTKTHLDNMFKEVEHFLLSTLTMIRNNREELRGALLTKE